MTLPAGMQRRIPRASTAGIIPLYPARNQGDERQGLIRVPVEWTRSKPHSEERRKFTACVDKQLNTWFEWLAKKGWTLNSTPKVTGPFDPPSTDAKSKPVDEGMKHYYATAYFIRDYPLYMPYDAAAWYRDEAYKYADDHMLAGIADSGVGPSKRDIVIDGPVDPMVAAAERRARLGIKRDDWTQQPLV